MNALKIALLVVVALLLVVVVIDRGRTPEQLKAVRDQGEQTNAALRQVTLELKAIRQALEARPLAAAPSGTASAAAAAADAERDGKPRLGVNFLKPYDASAFHPDRVRGTLKYFEVPPTLLNDIIENSGSTSTINGLVNDSLCALDPERPELWTENVATSVVISDDYKTFTFRIRPGIMWQRPAIAKEKGYEWLDRDVELTADDFVFYFELIKNPDVQCAPLKGYYEALDKAEALDAHTLRVRWSKKEYTNLSASLGISPQPRHVYARNADGSPIPADQLGATINKHWFDQAKQLIGIGAYVLEKFEPSKTLALVQNPAYWGAPMHFRRIEWDGVTKLPDARLVAFKNGQVHFMDGVLTPAQYKSEIVDGGEPRFDRQQGREGTFGWERVRGLDGRSLYNYLGWNLRRPIFKDKRVRQALAHALPKQRILDEIYFGLGRAQIGPVNPDSPYFDRTLKDYGFDLAKARELLAASGWADSDGDGWLDRDVDGKRVALRFDVTYYAANPIWPKVLPIYKDELAKIGVELRPSPADEKELERRMDDKDFDVLVSGWLSPLEADFVQIWHSKFANETKSSNYPGFADPRVDRLSEQLRETFELDKRIAIAVEVQRILHEEQPYLFFRSSESIFIWQNGKSGAGDSREVLGGVVEGFDKYHPLFNRHKAPWFFRE